MKAAMEGVTYYVGFLEKNKMNIQVAAADNNGADFGARETLTFVFQNCSLCK